MANLLGVIIGIVITFGVSSLIQRSNEQKDVREIMILLKKELKENREWLDKQRGNFLDDLSAYKEILDANGDWGKISDDVVAATRAIRIKFKSTNV